MEGGCRLADKHSDGMFEGGAVNLDIDGLRPGGFKRGLRLRKIDGGRDAGFEAAVGEVDGFLIRDDGGIEKLLFSVEAAKLKIVHGELGVKAEIHIGEIAGAGLRFGARGFDGLADAAPEVELVGEIEGQREIIVGANLGLLVEERRVFGLFGVARAGIDSDRRIQGATGNTNGRASFAELRVGRLQSLVRNVDLFFERIELGIAVNFPPLPFGDGVAGLRDFEVRRGFLVIGWDLGRGLHVLRPDRAAGERKSRDSSRCEYRLATRAHFPWPPGFCCG